MKEKKQELRELRLFHPLAKAFFETMGKLIAPREIIHKGLINFGKCDAEMICYNNKYGGSHCMEVKPDNSSINDMRILTGQIEEKLGAYNFYWMGIGDEKFIEYHLEYCKRNGIGLVYLNLKEQNCKVILYLLGYKIISIGGKKPFYNRDLMFENQLRIGEILMTANLIRNPSIQLNEYQKQFHKIMIKKLKKRGLMNNININNDTMSYNWIKAAKDLGLINEYNEVTDLGRNLLRVYEDNLRCGDFKLFHKKILRIIITHKPTFEMIQLMVEINESNVVYTIKSRLSKKLRDTFNTELKQKMLGEGFYKKDIEEIRLNEYYNLFSILKLTHNKNKTLVNIPYLLELLK